MTVTGSSEAAPPEPVGPALPAAVARRPIDVRRAVKRAAFTLAVTAFVLYSVTPLVWTAITSIQPEPDIIDREVNYLPREVTTENYTQLWEASDFPRLILNSFIVTVMTVAMSVGFGTLAAYSLSRHRFRGRNGILLFFLSIRMFPFVMMLIPLFIILRNLGLLDSRFGLALSYATFLLPLSIWLMKHFFDEMPAEIEDAARVDGCSRIQALWHVVLPLVRPGLAATSILAAISAWNEFLFALLLTTGSGSRTWPVGLQLMVGEFQLPFGQLTAGGVLTLTPVVVAYLLVGRTLVKGLMAGGLKG